MLMCVRFSFVLILGLLWPRHLVGSCPPGDFDGDCVVGFEDVQIMAEQWLGPPGSLADLDGLYGVEARDFALLAKQWQVSGIPLVINEFIAFNTKTGYDPQYEPDDWIEIHNFGDEAIDIAGMYLTDDIDVPTKWRAPFGRPDLTTIQGGGYLLIWADGEVWDSGLHACFELDGDGDEIGLYDSDGNTPLDTVVFSNQTPDISFGRYPDASDDWRFMILASPRSTNQLGYLGSVSEVEFSHADKLCDASFYVTLATETPGAVIYYTTDGSEPYVISGRTITGTVYTGPVLISRSVCLRAKAVKMGWKSSTPQTRAYVFLGSDVRGFSSNLPVAVIDTLEAGIGELAPTTSIAAFVDTGHDGRTHLIAYPPDFVGWAGIDIRGKSSAGFDKKQYHFETWDELGRDKDVSILKFPSESDWVLQGPFSDKSLMRNFLAYRWSNDMGRYAVRTRLIEVFLNTGGGSVSMSDYLGVYVFMEKIKLDNNRVDIIRLEPADNSEPSITGGYIVKKDKFDSGERTFTTLTGQTLIYVEPEGPDLTPWQAAWIQNYLKEFEQVLYGVKYADPVVGYTRYIDVRSFLDEHILVELTKNIDGFRLSTYMHKDRGGKLNMGPPWDYDLSLGNANYLEGWQPVGWYHDLLGDGDYPWWRRLFQDKEFGLKYADRWFGLRKDVLATHQLLADIDDTAALLNEAQVRNFDRWRILGIYVWPNWFIAQTYKEEIDWMKGWLEDRLTWMDAEIGRQFAAPPPSFDRQGGHFDQSLTLKMTAPYGQVYYTTNGSDPRLPGAIHYTTPVTLSSTTLVKARILNRTTWSALNEAVYAVGPVAESLRMSEIMYHPQGTGDPNDPNEEFIELTNIGGQGINLNLVRFTNGVEFTFGDVGLAPGGYILVVADRDVFEAQYGTGYNIAGEYSGRLQNEGERIELVDAAGKTIQDFRYRDGWRRLSDGLGFSLIIIDPTNPDPNSWSCEDSWRPSVYIGGSPGADDRGILPNPGSIVINEVLAHSHAEASDWLELYNTTGGSVDIGGWYLSDSDANLFKYRIKDGTRINAYGYLVFYEDANFGQDSHDPGRITPFAFSENGDGVYLSSAQAGVLTGYRAEEQFGASETGVSFGRYYKASTDTYNFVHTATATPRLGNSYPKVGPVVISEIMYHPDWPVGGAYTNDSYEYVELYNPGPVVVKLYRDDKALPWRFTEGIDYTFPAAPNAVTIPVGGYVVVVKDPNAFTWRYPAVPSSKIFGPYSGNLSNSGEQLELSLPGDVDEFGRRHYIQVERVGYSDGSHPEGDCPRSVDLWPSAADGGGMSLRRLSAAFYGNDPNNWQSSTPTPGQ